MFPASRNSSHGRMSAPFHDAARTASTMPQPIRYRRLRFRSAAAVASSGRLCAVILAGGIASATRLLPHRRELLIEVGELPVDLVELRLSVGIAQRRVGFDLLLLAEQVDLPNRDKLHIRGSLEAYPLLDAE